MSSIWEDGPRASFDIDGESDRATFVLSSIAEQGGNRIAKRERVYRDGERLDGMGTKGDAIVTQSVFNNNISEPGVPQNQYPDELNKLIELLKRSVTATGTLRLPTKAPRRVKAESWDIQEDAVKTDHAALTIHWAEDSEEVELESTFGAPNARSSAVAIAEDILAQIEFMGVISKDVEDLRSIAKKLEELAQFSGERGDDLLAASRDATDVVANIEADFLPSSNTLNDDDFVVGETGDSMLALPIAYSMLVSLRDFAEIAAQAAASVPGQSTPQATLYNSTQTLFDIADDNDIDIDLLVELNPSILDPGFIPANTPVFLPGF